MSNTHKNGSNGADGTEPLHVNIMSFGYKHGAPPIANLVFDMRFLKNPYWVEELKPLTGRDRPVQDYVLHQELAVEFLKNLVHMLDGLLPKLQGMNISDFSIAFGCTGGQHRSATMVEALASQLRDRYPQFEITKTHRELDKLDESDQELARATAEQLKAEI
jgi:RNase adapter protein RapZ